MALSYDYSGKLIGVPQLEAAPLTLQTLINSIRTEEASERGIVESQIASAAGKDDLGGGVSVGITVNLLSTWKLNFASGAYQATIDGGNLADALNRINNTGSPQVLVRASAAGTITTVVSGSGVTAQDKLDIAAQVLTSAQSSPIYADIHKVVGDAVAGDGTETVPWGPA
jgi:hypothetical protein